MSNSEYKDPEQRKVIEQVLNSFQQVVSDDAGKIIDNALDKERKGEIITHETPSVERSFFTLKNILSIPVFICLSVIFWFVSIRILLWLIPMPHSTRRLIAIVPAVVLSYIFLTFIDGLISKPGGKKE